VVVLRYCGDTQVLWYSGTVVLRYCGDTQVLSYSGTVVVLLWWYYCGGTTVVIPVRSPVGACELGQRTERRRLLRLVVSCSSCLCRCLFLCRRCWERTVRRVVSSCSFVVSCLTVRLCADTLTERKCCDDNLTDLSCRFVRVVFGGVPSSVPTTHNDNRSFVVRTEGNERYDLLATLACSQQVRTSNDERRRRMTTTNDDYDDE
jgi:hypothetical protein